MNTATAERARAEQARSTPDSEQLPLPRLGFIGTGWIGRLRMQALLRAECAEFCQVFDPSESAAREAAQLKPGIAISASIEDLLAADLDGVVIATPSAMHARQCEQALASGKAVFCQKPLARTAEETARVVKAAHDADRLLGIDFSYRHLSGMQQLKTMIDSGELGDIYAADLVFHNAYGPDKDWFYDVEKAGGGCVMDLGIHLVDLAMWLLNAEDAEDVVSHLFQQGKQITKPCRVVEDFATADCRLGEARVRLTCSWNAHAGRDAVIEVRLYGTRGGAAVVNQQGSFFDFEVSRFDGTSQTVLGSYPDDWGGRALTAWAKSLRQSSAFDPAVVQAIKVAALIDRIYGR